MNKKNQSFEHIIPDAIGGTLKSARLICIACNSAYGMTIDAALAKNFEKLITFLNVGWDRPRSRMRKDTAAPNNDPSQWRDGHMPVPVKPRIRCDKDQLCISACDKKQLMQIASGLKKKLPYIDLDSIEKKLEEDELVPGKLMVNFPAGSDLLLRSVAKIAVNYYLMKVRGRQYLDKIINVIDGIAVNRNDIQYGPLRDANGDNGELFHSITVKGTSASAKLNAHVVLFNTHSFTINLCDDYDGGDIDFCYRHDVLRREEIKGRID